MKQLNLLIFKLRNRRPKKGKFYFAKLFSRYYWAWIYTGFSPLPNTTPLLVQVRRKRGELSIQTQEHQKPKPSGKRIRISNKWPVSGSLECTPKSVHVGQNGIASWGVLERRGGRTREKHFWMARSPLNCCKSGATTAGTSWCWWQQIQDLPYYL